MSFNSYQIEAILLLQTANRTALLSTFACLLTLTALCVVRFTTKPDKSVLPETHKSLTHLELASSSPQHRGLYHHEQASQTRPSHGILE